MGRKPESGGTFTDKFIRNLKPTDKLQDMREKDGFGIRVTPGGVKTWFFIYRLDGKRRFMNLGHYPSITLEEARKKHRAALALAEQGKDPMGMAEEAREERRKAPTVADLADEYIERHAKKFKRSWRKDEQVLNRDVIPAWGKRKAKDIAKRDVILLMEGIVDRGAPIMANYVFQVTRKMFNWAVEQDILTSTPFLGTKLPSPTNKRERVLSEDEIFTLWGSLDRTDLNMSDSIRRALRLILVTAQRPGEVIGMHSDEIDGHWWTIPAERAKNRKTHRIYLTRAALDLIGPTEGKGYIFPAPFHLGESQEERPIGCNALAVAVGRNLAYPLTDKTGQPLFTAGGKPATENRLGIDHFTPHDLRRTAATFMAKNGEMDEVIDAVLNHAKQGVIKVYNQYRYDREKQQALETWERKLNGILTGERANVVSIRSRKKANAT